MKATLDGGVVTTLMSSVRRGVLVLAVALGGAGVLAACGDDQSGPDVARSYDVELKIDDSQDDYKFVAVGEVPDFTVGDQVTFVVENTGQFSHDLQVQAPDGDIVASADAVAAGDTLEATAFLGQVGIYRLNCTVDDHLTTHSMQTLIEVAPAELTS